MAESALRTLLPSARDRILSQQGQMPTAPVPQETFRGQAFNTMYDMFGGSSEDPARRAQATRRAESVMGAGRLAADFTPVVGDALAIDEVRDAYRQGNYGTAAILGGATMLGMLPVAGDAASKAIRGTLDMSQAARMQRAAEGKFVPTTGYHGTSVHKSEGQLFDEFQLFEGDDLTRSVSRSPVGKLGVSIAHQPEVASDFAYQASPADGEGATIMPLTFRSDKSGTINLSGDETNDEIFGTVVDAWKDGYDAIHFTNYTTPAGTKGSFTLIKDPAQVRSVNAAFDPTKRGSANLLAGAAGATIGLSALRNIQREDEQSRID